MGWQVLFSCFFKTRLWPDLLVFYTIADIVELYVWKTFLFPVWNFIKIYRLVLKIYGQNPKNMVIIVWPVTISLPYSSVAGSFSPRVLIGAVIVLPVVTPSLAASAPPVRMSHQTRSSVRVPLPVCAARPRGHQTGSPSRAWVVAAPVVWRHAPPLLCWGRVSLPPQRLSSVCWNQHHGQKLAPVSNENDILL